MNRTTCLSGPDDVTVTFYLVKVLFVVPVMKLARGLKKIDNSREQAPTDIINVILYTVCMQGE